MTQKKFQISLPWAVLIFEWIVLEQGSGVVVENFSPWILNAFWLFSLNSNKPVRTNGIYVQFADGALSGLNSVVIVS